jgi:phospholipase C
MIILMENHGYHDLIGSTSAPYINSLATGYASATSWTDVSHPSLPNYLALTAGSIFANPQDCIPTWATPTGDCTFDTTAPSLADQLTTAGISWKAYLEDMPSACDKTDAFGPGNYDVNHNPFVYYDHVVNNAAECNRVVPYTQLASDLGNGTLPSFIWVSPNLIHDMHDGTIGDGDNFLQGLIPQIQSSAWYSAGGRIILTWDEGETEEQIVALVISAATKGHGAFTSAGNHYGTLRAIEELYGLPLLGNAGDPANGDLRPLL